MCMLGRAARPFWWFKHNSAEKSPLAWRELFAQRTVPAARTLGWRLRQDTHGAHSSYAAAD